MRQQGRQGARLLAAFDDDEAVVRALEWADQPGNHLVTSADAAYPKALLETSDPPALLYVKGRVELLNARALAIVGARNATAQGELQRSAVRAVNCRAVD